MRCFTFGKTDITPVAYDPRERRYLVDHEYLSPELGARVVRDAQTINLALGYEMNTIEFAIARRRAVRDRLPQSGAGLRTRSHHRFLFLARRREDERTSSIDRALNGDPSQCWPRWEEMLGIGTGVRLHRRARHALQNVLMDAIGDWHALLRPDDELTPRFTRGVRRRRCGRGS